MSQSRARLSRRPPQIRPRGARTAGPMLAAVLLLASATASPAGETLRIGGTGAARGLAGRLGEAFSQRHPQWRVEALPSLGSTGGIRALRDGAIEIAFTSRPLREEEAKAGLVVREFGRTPLALVTGSRRLPGGFGAAQLARTYRGGTVTWPDGTRLRIVMRPASESDTALIRSLSPEMDAAVATALEREGLLVALTDQDNAALLGSTPGAVGFISLAQLRTEDLPLIVLPLEGSLPDLAALSAGRYPLVKPFYVVTPAQPAASAAAFVEFLFSRDGARILEDSGTQPAAAHARE